MLKILSLVVAVTAISLMSAEVHAAGRRCGGCGGGRGRATVPSNDSMSTMPSIGHEGHAAQATPEITSPLTNSELRRSFSYEPLVPAPMIASPAPQRLRSRTPTYMLPNADLRKHNGGF